jgi:hypothetical protein
MMGEVKALRKGPPPPPEVQKNAAAIRLLEEALQRAKDGESHGVMVVEMVEGFAQFDFAEIDDAFTVAGHLQYLIQLLLNEPGEGEPEE